MKITIDIPDATWAAIEKHIEGDVRQTPDGKRVIVEPRYDGPADWLREQLERLLGPITEKRPSAPAKALMAEIAAKRAELAALNSVGVKEEK